MNQDLNRATRRLLQVVLDMLSNPHYDTLIAEREAALEKGEKPYGIPSPYRVELIAVEAAHRAATEAQQMLAQAMEPMVYATETHPGTHP